MAMLNVRVEDHIYERIKELAEDEGLSLSEYVRDRLLEIAVPISERIEHGDEPAPESLNIRDRMVLSLLHRILARVAREATSGEDLEEDHQLKKAEILESGFTGEYWLEVAGFETELSKSDSRRVIEILQMFRIITFSIQHLEKEGSPVSPEIVRKLEFRGFDHNDTLEGHMARYVRFLMRDEHHWTELKPQTLKHDNGNSHMPTLETYLRMLAEFRRIMKPRERSYSPDDYLLSLEELDRLVKAQVHPSYR